MKLCDRSYKFFCNEFFESLQRKDNVAIRLKARAIEIDRYVTHHQIGSVSALRNHPVIGSVTSRVKGHVSSAMQANGRD